MAAGGRTGGLGGRVGVYVYVAIAVQVWHRVQWCGAAAIYENPRKERAVPVPSWCEGAQRSGQPSFCSSLQDGATGTR